MQDISVRQLNEENAHKTDIANIDRYWLLLRESDW